MTDAHEAWTTLALHAKNNGNGHRATGIARAADRRTATARDRSPLAGVTEDDTWEGIAAAVATLPPVALRYEPTTKSRVRVFGGGIRGNRDAFSGRVVGTQRRRIESQPDAFERAALTLVDAEHEEMEHRQEAERVLRDLPAWVREVARIERGEAERPAISDRHWLRVRDEAEQAVREFCRGRGILPA